MPLLGLLIFINLARAEWKVGRTLLEVEPCPRKSCLISSSCLKRVSKCEARKAFDHPKKSRNKDGGNNPGSEVCTSYPKAGVLLALNNKGDTQAFCRFKDGSLLTLDGLWVW